MDVDDCLAHQMEQHEGGNNVAAPQEQQLSFGQYICQVVIVIFKWIFNKVQMIIQAIVNLMLISIWFVIYYICYTCLISYEVICICVVM